MANVLRQNKLIIYRLKRNYGLLAIINKPLNNSINIQTGRMVREWESRTVQRLVRLPSDILRSFSYDLSYIAANKNFTYGGLFDKDTRIFIIDRKDIKDFEIDPNCNITVPAEDYRYEVLEVFAIEELAAYIIKAKRVVGDEPVEQNEPSPSPS